MSTATRQSFHTIDRLRLEVEEDPTGLVNLVANPSGDLGGWGWVTPVPNTSLVTLWTSQSGQPTYPSLRFASSAAQACHVRTELMPVDGGAVGGRAIFSASSSVEVRASWEFYDANRALLSTSSLTREWLGGEGPVQKKPQAAIVPVGAAYVALRLDPHPPGTSTMVLPSGGSFTIREVTIVNAPNKLQAENLDAYIQPVSYRNIINPATSIKINRESFNLGTLAATVKDSTLDPAASSLIRPGRRVRALALITAPGAGPTWEPLFLGELKEASVTYALKDPAVPASKRATIELMAVDGMSTLANVSRPQGVGTINELRWVLEGAGVPWAINGNGQQLPTTATVVSTVEDASAADQITMTRDSKLGEAWLDRRGIVRVYDRAYLPTSAAATLDEGVYSDLDVAWSAADCINEVHIRLLRPNLATGQTVEVPYGPYRDADSVKRWGAFSATFTIHGLPDAALDMGAYANMVLTRCANPTRRINSISIPIKDADNFTGTGAISVLRDLCDRVRVTNSTAALDAHLLVRTIEHTITPTKWLMLLGFGDVGSVAMPTAVPAPTTVDIESGWVPLALASGALPNLVSGAAYDPASRVTGKTVRLRGVARRGSGTWGAGEAVGTLPAAARPDRVVYALCPATNHQFMAVQLLPSGAIEVKGSLVASTNTSPWLALDGITYDLT